MHVLRDAKVKTHLVPEGSQLHRRMCFATQNGCQEAEWCPWPTGSLAAAISDEFYQGLYQWLQAHYITTTQAGGHCVFMSVFSYSTSHNACYSINKLVKV